MYHEINIFIREKIKKIKYSYLLEQFRFGWHFELQNISLDLYLLVHLLNNYFYSNIF
jgi:hypothetical protein